MPETPFCTVERTWPQGEHSQMELRCDLYANHSTPRHRTTIEADGIVIYWVAVKP